MRSRVKICAKSTVKFVFIVRPVSVTRDGMILASEVVSYWRWPNGRNRSNNKYKFYCGIGTSFNFHYIDGKKIISYQMILINQYGLDPVTFRYLNNLNKSPNKFIQGLDFNESMSFTVWLKCNLIIPVAILLEFLETDSTSVIGF